MLWGQAFASFVAWLIYGALLARRAPETRVRYGALSRKRRAVLGPVLMIVAAGVMLGGVAIVGLFQGIRNHSLVGWAWLVLTLMGIAFVHIQSTSALMMISLSTDNEPSRTAQTSDGRNGNNADESQTAAPL